MGARGLKYQEHLLRWWVWGDTPTPCGDCGGTGSLADPGALGSQGNKHRLVAMEPARQGPLGADPGEECFVRQPEGVGWT